ncbi:unnamed protein product [Staurois parvus]|uniref:Uncharacterized protein n=2 Tax=Staurois parvus TaxID=386267 RepID=A0ABN9GV02_9NEOB|nr:unnamed protein product [Staurois parvus]
MAALTTSRIEKLQLYDTHLTDSSCPHLASGIRNNPTLRTLNLSGNNLEGPHFRDLMAALTTSRIEGLQLSSNHLTDSSCPHLVPGIRNNPTLRTLNLSGNNLGGPHFRDLMAALTTSRIEELQLSSNHLTDSSCPHLASGIKNKPDTEDTGPVYEQSGGSSFLGYDGGSDNKPDRGITIVL